MKPDEKLKITEKMIIDQKEFDVLKENQMVKLLIEVEKLSNTVVSVKSVKTAPETPQEDHKNKTFKVTKGFVLPPGAEPLPVTMEISKEELKSGENDPKPKKKVLKKVKKAKQNEEIKKENLEENKSQ